MSQFNGLDPEGILWIRTLLRNLAAEGRTVFVSSHLMSEMALTADRLIIIGKGHLLADASTADIVAGSSRSYVLVRTPEPRQLGKLLRDAGATIISAPDDEALRVTGLTCADIGELALRNNVAIHELTPIDASLESAYLDLTRDHVDFHVAATINNASKSGTEI
jgi:ABC-2 type transport system ATP-binding protein